MRRLVRSLLLLAVLATGLPLSAQTAVGPCRMDGTDCAAGGGGSGTVTSVGNGTIGPLFGASWATATSTPALSLNLAAQAANCVIAGPASGGNAVPTCRSLVAADIGFTLNQNTSGNAATATALAANPAACSAGQYVSDVAADGTLTCSAVTGTLSGLTATKLPVATSATAVGDSAITHVAATGVTTFGGSGPKLVLNDYAGGATPAMLYWDGGNGLFRFRNSTDSADVNIYASIGSFVAEMTSQQKATTGDTVTLTDDGFAAPFGMSLKNGAIISWPNSYTPAQAYTETGVQVSQSKALVDATATAFSRVAVASNSYEGGVLYYTIYATDATDYQNRSGSVPFAIRNLGGTETCTFGTASDAYDGTGTLTVTWDCAAGTDTVDLRATADTSLASTTIFTIQARVDLTSGLATVTPQ